MADDHKEVLEDLIRKGLVPSGTSYIKGKGFVYPETPEKKEEPKGEPKLGVKKHVRWEIINTKATLDQNPILYSDVDEKRLDQVRENSATKYAFDNMSKEAKAKLEADKAEWLERNQKRRFPMEDE
jgi:hypothetical protein